MVEPAPQASSPHIVRFGVFELDQRTGELRKAGLKLGLQDQPLHVLTMLLERPGELVTRDELKERLWPAHTFVDFEQGLNAAVKRLRTVLGDSADTPRFIETLPRRGYRFVASVGPPGAVSVPATARGRSRLALGGSLAAVATALAVTVWISSGRRQPKAIDPPRIASLAILPLKNLTGDPAQEYFADAMTDALSATFSRLGGLTVVSSTSSGRYRDSSRPAPQIAQELGVDALLEGTVLRSGSRVRVNAALVHGATGRRLWARTYDHDLADVLTLYAEIAQMAAREMSLVLTDSQRARLVRSGTLNAKAYDEYLRATYLMNRWMAGGCPKAEPHFLKAIELDPQFAQPHAGLVWCYVFPDRMQRPITELAPRARALTARAMELDPTLGSAHVALGVVRQFIDYDWDGAEQAFRHAVELDPSSSQAHIAYGELLYMRGRADESIAMLRRAVQLDPSSPDRNVGFGFGLMNLRRYDDAIEQLRSTLELEPEYATAQHVLAQALELRGDHAESVATYLAWLDQTLLPERAPQARASLEAAYARSGWDGFWHREMELATEAADRPGTVRKPQYARYDKAVLMAQRHIRLGHRDLALDLLEKAYEERHHLVASLNSNPMWDGIRGEPRFQALVRRIGLTPR